MAVSRLSTSRVGSGLPKYQKLWDGTSAGPAMDSIQTVNGTGSSGTLTFSNIPNGYSALQLRIYGITSGASYYGLRFNGDTAENYGYGQLYYNAGITAAVAPSTNMIYLANISSSSYPTGAVFDINDYTSTYKTKTASGFGWNDIGTTGGYLFARNGYWSSSSPVTSISIVTDSGTFSSTTIAALYGIR